MKIQLTSITRSPKGNPIRSSRLIEASEIRLGRGAECECHLPDPRVAIHAKTITLGEQGPQIVDMVAAGKGGAESRPQPLKTNATLRIGPYSVQVLPLPAVVEGAAPEFDLALSVELVNPLPENTKRVSKEIFAHTRHLGRWKRIGSWGLLLGVLAWFLVLPVINSHYGALLALPATAKQAAAPGLVDHPAVINNGLAQRVSTVATKANDQSWNPGELSRGHQSLANNCSACHSVPFARVKDADCLACHENAAAHVSPKVGKVAKLDESRCASCHIDHKGALALKEQNSHYTAGECASCHRDIKAALPNTLTGNAGDFAKQHPEFRYNVSVGLKKTDVVRARLNKTTPLTDKTALKFPHDVHLNPKGVKGPQGLTQVTCSSCHKPDSTGQQFLPVTMKANCQSCHELRFEPAVSSRQVPHGNVADVLLTLREFYSAVALDGVALDQPIDAQITRQPPGKTAPVAQRLFNSGDAQSRANQAAQALFEKTACMVCHEVSKAPSVNGQLRWDIAPIRADHPWLTKARFPHDKHTMANCGDCHQAKVSKSSQDVLMPGIDTCRTCHAGKQPEPQKLVSNCVMCHGFHVTDHRMPPNVVSPAVTTKLRSQSQTIFRARHLNPANTNPTSINLTPTASKDKA
jgi:hypothetical protein